MSYQPENILSDYIYCLTHNKNKSENIAKATFKPIFFTWLKLSKISNFIKFNVLQGLAPAILRNKGRFFVDKIFAKQMGVIQPMQDDDD